MSDDKDTTTEKIYDLNGDGIPDEATKIGDTTYLDWDRDGKFDAMVTPEGEIYADLDGSYRFRTRVVDADGDGTIDTLETDVDGDGIPDVIERDTTGDGILDSRSDNGATPDDSVTSTAATGPGASTTDASTADPVPHTPTDAAGPSTDDNTGPTGTAD